MGVGLEGVFCLPLTVLRLSGRELGQAARAGVGCGPVGAGRCGGRAAGGFEEVEPFLMPVPAIGQVKGEAVAAVAGGAGGDTDQGPADRGRAGEVPRGFRTVRPLGWTIWKG